MTSEGSNFQFLAGISRRSCRRFFLAVALFPDRFRLQFVDPNGQHIFVVAAVEDHDFAICGCVLVDAPKEVMRCLAGRWLFKTSDMHTLRVYAAEDVLNGATFAAGIHSLKND
jgi:hypothetical protein